MSLKHLSIRHYYLDEGFAKHHAASAHAEHTRRFRRLKNEFIDYWIIRQLIKREVHDETLVVTGSGILVMAS